MRARDANASHLFLTAQPSTVSGRLRIVPIELRDANAFIFAHHRHHKPVQGHRYSIAAMDEAGVVHGVCVVGRPVARNADQATTVEVTRLCSDGSRNVCSLLYAAAARVARNMGFERIQTYTLPQEGGASLRACGWVNESEHGGGQWKHTDNKPRRTDQPIGAKFRWALDLTAGGRQAREFALPALKDGLKGRDPVLAPGARPDA